MTPPPSTGRRIGRALLWMFALAWAASQVVRCTPDFWDVHARRDGTAVVIAAPVLGANGRSVTRSVTDREPRIADEYDTVQGLPAGSALLACNTFGEPEHPALLLLHGSPGRATNFTHLAPRLAEHFFVIVPDMLGFGRSSLDVSDYGCRAQAAAMLELLTAFELERAHVIGYSFGGGVGIEMADLAPERVASLTLFSSIGVQELELLGDYHLNHALHGLQHAALWLALNIVPHFGAWDGHTLGFSRSFYDTDQRPLRGILERYAGPLLIVHGEHDPLVPAEAALEHHRIVPQSELVMMDASHFLPFRDDHDLHKTIETFVDRVESGSAVTRADADPVRLADAASPYDPTSAPPATGFFLGTILVLLALSTLVSEDLACIGAGLMVGAGRLPFLHATFACFVGIFVGDIALYLAGRWLGRPAVERAPLRWVLTPSSVATAERFFARRGIAAVFISRFVPGFRLPTYFAAGLVKQGFWRFTLAFLVACAIWTPILVGAAVLLGAEAKEWVETFGRWAPYIVVGAIVLLYLALRWIVPLSTARGRATVRGRWLRLRHWEFWPAWTLYVPVLFAVAWCALRHRSLRVVTAANPSMPTGGLVGESKGAILAGLVGAGPALARHGVVDASLANADRHARLDAIVDALDLSYPVVVKPDRGQRGDDVVIARTRQVAIAALDEARDDSIVQEFVPGVEFGIFYARHPHETVGRVLSITAKVLPTVTGDGQRTIEQLILADDRAVALASAYLEQLGAEAGRVPELGETVPIAQLGTHCRGAIFRDANHLATDALTEAIDRISRADEGFFFGRYDVRVPDEQALREGRDLKVLELNGLTSEPAHIYDRRHSIVYAWRALCAQWSLAYRIGAANAARGAKPSSWREITTEVATFLRG